MLVPHRIMNTSFEALSSMQDSESQMHAAKLAFELLKTLARS